LILYILSYHLRIEANGIDTIALGPKVIPPIGLFLEVRKLLKTRIAVLPFRVPINWDMEAFGGTLVIKWI